MSAQAALPTLQGKHIVLGVSGGIAAYKSALLARLLKKAGADIKVVMTQGAHAFITPLTFQALTGNSVHDTLLDADAEAGMGHIELARWADLVVIAPATANVIARLANGHADDLLTTICLASPAPKYLAPAMNQQMWSNPIVRANTERLETFGWSLLGPDDGEQACGDVGSGRMLEPETIVERLLSSTSSPAERASHSGISGKKVVITAGPTREALDPVRYLSNYSSGKMGYALAAAAYAAGASVTLISGPVQLEPPRGVTVVNVTSAEQMLDAARSESSDADIFIAAAAVADFRPQQVAEHKIKKGGDSTASLELVKNPDIVATIAGEYASLFCVGFAAETQSLLENASSKLTRKKLDMIVANQVGEGLAFDQDSNAVTLLWQDAQQTLQQRAFPMQSKHQLARQLLDAIFAHYQAQ
ncbi:bifunctional phosphopantothenoylcysteine decarboxylase/phosphopantothenate--cysteine ligase CoaBC [Carnimonas bestiolae]|uniref:bifunctional phosphopantothenoylcysteine decarboxylase/phosphopantothenate--cysteine ligase CoaBC n=1 Tax=Carnimonas bestiolae TaxID=3402172 RepID=UPI003EDBD5D9